MSKITEQPSYQAGVKFGEVAARLYASYGPLHKQAKITIGSELSRRTANYPDVFRWAPEICEKLAFHDIDIPLERVHEMLTSIRDLSGQYHNHDFRFGFWTGYGSGAK